jgi:hypothetical protein
VVQEHDPKPRPFEVGDPMPPISLPDTVGGGRVFNERSIPGATLVFWLAGAAPSAAEVEDFVGHRPAIEAAGARLFAVTHAQAVHGLDTFCDPENKLARAVGLDRRGAIVLDPEFRLAAIVADGQGAADVVAACRRFRDLAPEEKVRGQAPVLMVHRALDAGFCGRLVDYWAGGQKLLNLIADVGGEALYDPGTLKRRADVAVTDAGLVAALSNALSRRIAPGIEKAFQRRVTRFEGFKVGCYDAAERGAFGPHRDNATPFSRNRLFAISLNLNSGYAGGEIRFPEFGRRLYRPDAGDALVFSCSLLHEAMPVVSGRRFGLFTFLYDDATESR